MWLLLALPVLWLVLFLLGPLLIILVVSFYRSTLGGYEAAFSLSNYVYLFTSWNNLRIMWYTFLNALVTVIACLVLGYPVAYFLTFYVEHLRTKIALFVFVLAPFWTSYLIRAITWLPLLGRNGLINQFLLAAGVIKAPLEILLYSNLAVVLAMTQLFILFMVAPIFFSLSNIDPDTIEAASDLGSSHFQIFREIIWPLSLPGVIIGCMFVAVLSLGNFATYTIIGGGNTSSLGVMINNFAGFVQYPTAAATGSILVVLLCVVVWVLLRFRNVLEEL